MPATTLDGADRLIGLAKLVTWPPTEETCRRPLVNVTKIGVKYGVRVKVAGQQRYFGALESEFAAARLADLITHAFVTCDEARFNYSRERAIEDMKQSDLADLVQRWELLFKREKVITEPENVVDLNPGEVDLLRIQLRDLEARVTMLESIVARFEKNIHITTPAPQPATVTAIRTPYKGPAVVPFLFKKP